MMFMQHLNVYKSPSTSCASGTSTSPSPRPRSHSLGKLSMFRPNLQHRKKSTCSSKKDHLQVSPKLPRSRSTFSNEAIQLNGKGEGEHEFDDHFGPFRLRVSVKNHVCLSVVLLFVFVSDNSCCLCIFRIHSVPSQHLCYNPLSFLSPLFMCGVHTIVI